MSQSGEWQTAAMVLAAILCVGCMPTAKSQLVKCQSEKKQLLTRVVDEQERAQTLLTENRQLHEKLADAETQLAKLHDGHGSGLADFRRPNLASPSATPPATRGRPTPDLNSADTRQATGAWTPKQSLRPPAAAKAESSSR